jgi:hypothetical protein
MADAIEGFVNLQMKIEGNWIIGITIDRRIL